MDLPSRCESPGPPPPIEREHEAAEERFFDPPPHAPPPIDLPLLDRTKKIDTLSDTLLQPIAVDAAEIPPDTVLLPQPNPKPKPKPKSTPRSDCPMGLPPPFPAPEVFGTHDVREAHVEVATRGRVFNAGNSSCATMAACTPGVAVVYDIILYNETGSRAHPVALVDPSSEVDAQAMGGSAGVSTEDMRPSSMRQNAQAARLNIMTSTVVRTQVDNMMPSRFPLTMPSSGQIPQALGIAPPLSSCSGGMPAAARKIEKLFDAVSCCDIGMVRALLASGMDVNEYTARGSHILFRAIIKARNVEILRLLVSHNANVRSTDERGSQVLHFWARATVGRHALLDIGRLLLSAGADPNPQRHDDGMSPLHHVTVGHNNRRGWQDFHKALLLVRNGASIFLSTSAGQFPCSLISPDGRNATRKLTQLLTHDIPAGVAQGGWPTCEYPGCPWCM